MLFCDKTHICLGKIKKGVKIQEDFLFINQGNETGVRQISRPTRSFGNKYFVPTALRHQCHNNQRIKIRCYKTVRGYASIQTGQLFFNYLYPLRHVWSTNTIYKKSAGGTENIVASDFNPALISIALVKCRRYDPMFFLKGILGNLCDKREICRAPNETVNIINIESSCGCTNVHVPNKNIKAKDSILIKMDIDTGYKDKGKHSENVVLTTDGQRETYILLIKFEID